MALSQHFIDSHPPLMAWWWGVLLKLFPHAAPAVPMLTFHLLMYFGSLYIMARSLYPQSTKAAWAVVLLALVPHVICITGVIWKDVGMAFSYLLVSALLIRVSIYGWWNVVAESAFIWLCVFYAVSIKYQAQYIMPIMVCWWVWLMPASRVWIKAISCLAICFSILLTSQATAFKLVQGSKGQKNFWQVVMLYELAVLSKATHQDLFPEYIKSDPSYDFTKLEQTTRYDSIDPILGLLRSTQNQEHLNQLKAQWRKQILAYPLKYLQFRFIIWGRMLDSKYSVAIIPENKHGFKQPDNIFSYLLVQYLKFGWHYTPFFHMSVIVPISAWLIYSLIRRKAANNLGVAIFAMQASAWSLLFTLVFCSVASQYRYGYTAVLLIIFSVPLLVLLKEKASLVDRTKSVL